MLIGSLRRQAALRPAARLVLVLGAAWPWRASAATPDARQVSGPPAAVEDAHVHAPPAPEPEISPPEPPIAVDDIRTHAPILGEHYQLAATYRYLGASAGSHLVTAQLGLGPAAFDEVHLGAILGWLRSYALRVRATGADSAGDRLFGPLTFALQRYVFVDPVDIAPLLHLHFGIEAALSTPWLSGRQGVPDEAIRTAMAVDTELASNGWSLRPASVYLRADLLICRSIYFEVGAGPEVFVPTLPGARREYDVRFHSALGASLACVHARDSWTKNLDVVLAYRGRGKLYSDDDPPDIFNEASLELQRRGLLTAGAFVSSNFHSFVVAGARLQIGGH